MEKYRRLFKVLWKFIEIARNIWKGSITHNCYIKKSIKADWTTSLKNR